MASDDIQGTIVDQGGNAVEGAVVYLFSQDNTNVVAKTTTDANGNYIFNSHPDGDGSSQNWHIVAEYDDGTNYYNTYSKPYVNAQVFSPIPDSGIYLHDDWGDNKLQNRDESGTTTYNGVEGVYRPEWTIDESTADANNQQLELSGGAVKTDINLDLSSEITWSWTGVSLSGVYSDGQASFGCYMDPSASLGDIGGRVYSGDGVYFVSHSSDGEVGLGIDTNGTFSDTSISTSMNPDNISSVTVIRRVDPVEWELLINGSSVGTTQTSSSADVGFIYFGDRQDGHTVDEVKVS